jgi:DNA-binding LacI/PurR family transcriptional regulator
MARKPKQESRSRPAIGGDASATFTSYDVAQRAGVSQSAVSRCFRPGSSIAPKTRLRVLAAARELGYQPNAMASALITRQSNLVAILISNLTNLYYPEALSEMTRRLSERGIRVLLFTLETESEVDATLDQVWRYRVDGAIVAARLSTDQLRDFARRGVPVVLYNRFGEGEPVPSVCCDSIGGERMLVDRLVAAGHKCFGMIAGPDDSYVSQERIRGAQERLRELGYDLLVVDGKFDYDSGQSGLRALMAKTGGGLDAVICANDLMAVGAIDCARNAFNIAVPEGLSVVGFDGVAPAMWTSYRVCTVRQPVGRMTEAAVVMLTERIADPDLPPEVRTFAGTFIEGASARLI